MIFLCKYLVGEGGGGFLGLSISDREAIMGSLSFWDFGLIGFRGLGSWNDRLMSFRLLGFQGLSLLGFWAQWLMWFWVMGLRVCGHGKIEAKNVPGYQSRSKGHRSTVNKNKNEKIFQKIEKNLFFCFSRIQKKLIYHFLSSRWRKENHFEKSRIFPKSFSFTKLHHPTVLHNWQKWINHFHVSELKRKARCHTRFHNVRLRHAATFSKELLW